MIDTSKITEIAPDFFDELQKLRQDEAVKQSQIKEQMTKDLLKRCIEKASKMNIVEKALYDK